jgi:probable rRNA maturation factor
MERISIINKTRSKLPSLPLFDIKGEILGKNYSLSIVFIGEKRMKNLNSQYRKKNKSTNILSFPLDKNTGEIFICPQVVKTQLKKFDRNFREMIGFLLIHGMLHLKGMEHSDKMERAEQKYDKKYFRRNRHRVVYNKSSSRRIS